MIRPLAAGALMALAGLSSLPQATPLVAKTHRATDDIRWTYGEGGHEGHSHPELRISRDGNNHFDTREAAGLMGLEAIAALDSPGSAVAFTVAREAGTLACAGSVLAPQRAEGRCRFDASPAFADALARKGLSPSSDGDFLAAALVDARMTQVEGLEREGYRFGEFDDVLAVAALEVTGEFARSLRSAGLRFGTLENLIGAKAVGVSGDYVASLRTAGLAIDNEEDIVAAKAVGVDPAWLTSMAQVGYADLSAEQAIQLKAMDVTPDYAVRMARVIAAVGE